MRYIYVILTVLILSSASNAESSPNAPPSTTLPASPNTPPAVQPTPPPTTIQPTTSHSDDTVRVERDAYKQVVEAHQKTLSTIEWSMGIIATFVLALIGYALTKDKKEYEKVLEQAKEASEKAEQWEEKARAAFEKIDIRVESKLKQIEKQGKESVENIVKQTQKETLASKYWSDALNLDNQGKYDEASDKYAELVKLRPDDYLAYTSWGTSLVDWARIKDDENIFEMACQKFEQAIRINPHMSQAYNNWGAALDDLARIKGNEELFKEACGKYAKAVEIKPDYYEAYNNWGIALGDLAKFKGNEELFKDACGKFAKAIEIKPDKHEAYNGWAGCLLDFAKLKIGKPEYESLRKQAEEKALKAESIKKGEGAYNLACGYALRGIKEQCKIWLLVGQEADTLPKKNVAMKDNDLDSVKNEAWFKAIKWKGER